MSEIPTFIEGSSLNSAREKLAQPSAESIAAAREELMAAIPDRRPETESEGLHYIRLMHILGDTYACEGEYEAADALYNEALTEAEEMLGNDYKTRLYKSLLHASLAETTRITGGTMKQIGHHTAQAMNIMAGHPEAWRTDMIRLFCFRTLLLDSADRRASDQSFFHDVVERHLSLPNVRREIPDFTINDSFPPLSAYFEMPD